MSYLLKNVSIQELAQAIRSAHAGLSTWSLEVTEALIQELPNQLQKDFTVTGKKRFWR